MVVDYSGYQWGWVSQARAVGGLGVAFPTAMCDRPRTAVETPMPLYNNHFFIALTLVARGGKTTKAKLKTAVKYGMNCTKIK